jgi:hypothetical protein
MSLSFNLSDSSMQCIKLRQGVVRTPDRMLKSVLNWRIPFAFSIVNMIALSAFSASANAAPNAVANVAREIKAPYYGDGLFQFFQDHYFTAVTNLMVSQHFGRIDEHADEAEILRGGILLSYGLHREAETIFSRLTEMGASAAVKDRAWFYLAKIRYQRGYLDLAEAAIIQVGKNLSAELLEDRALLHANLLMARSDFSGAAAILTAVSSKAKTTRYIRFNLGVALIKAGDVARGKAMLNQLGLAAAENEEYRSLRDRANVALGLTALSTNEPKEARTYLERVRLKSPQASKALLGLGWSADALKETQNALVPWQELAQRDVVDTATLEALIAVPYAYAKLEAFGQATDQYKHAIERFITENEGLKASIVIIRSGQWLDVLTESNPGEELGWFYQLRDISSMPKASHLAQVLGQHEFQEAFKNYRDLRFLQKNLEEWRDKLLVFQAMLDNRREAFAKRLPEVIEQNKELAVQPLRERKDVAETLINAGEAQEDGVAFADAKQIEQQGRLAEVQAALKSVPDDPDFTKARERARLLEGALTWQLAQDFSIRVWQVKKDLQTITEELERAQILKDALQQAQRDEPARFDAFAKRIAAMTPVLEVMIPRVASLTREQQLAVQGIAIAELTRQQDRLNAYTTQARFALAQLYDRGTLLEQDKSSEKKATEGKNAITK